MKPKEAFTKSGSGNEMINIHPWREWFSTKELVGEGGTDSIFHIRTNSLSSDCCKANNEHYLLFWTLCCKRKYPLWIASVLWKQTKWRPLVPLKRFCATCALAGETFVFILKHRTHMLMYFLSFIAWGGCVCVFFQEDRQRNFQTLLFPMILYSQCFLPVPGISLQSLEKQKTGQRDMTLAFGLLCYIPSLTCAPIFWAWKWNRVSGYFLSLQILACAIAVHY